jgi:hypothetical protein
MKEIRFEQSYTSDDARTYTSLPFDMPRGIERIEIEYNYPRYVTESLPEGTAHSEVNIIDLGIYDHEGTLYGWSGSNRRSVFISTTSASPGYRHGAFTPGKWAIALGLYKISDTVSVSLTLRLYPKERKLLRGDLHLHTLNSDGIYTTAFVLESATQGGLDFVALTDHNNTQQNTEIGPTQLTVIPGVEYTNYRGHANFFFPDTHISFHDNFLSNTFEEMAGVFRRAKDAGAYISLNHPFSPCPWEFGFERFPFDMLEVWNGPIYGGNIQAIACWHELLCAGKKIAAVGGSDLHKNELGRTFGTPCTYVYANGVSVPDILDALCAGHSGVTFTPEGPLPDISIADAGLGDTVSFSPGLTGMLNVTRAMKGDTLKLLTRDGLALSCAVPFNGTYQCSFPVERHGFYRLELYRQLLDFPMLCALSNPIYVRE